MGETQHGSDKGPCWAPHIAAVSNEHAADSPRVLRELELGQVFACCKRGGSHGSLHTGVNICEASALYLSITVCRVYRTLLEGF